MDRLEGMELFLRVIDRGSLSAAGRELGLSPAAVSNHIRALEDWVGARLLNRTTRALTLTEAGQAFRARCELILSEVGEAQTEASMLQGSPRGVLRVSAPVAFGARWLGAPLATYLNQYPAMELDVVLSDRKVDLIEEGFDVAIRIGNLDDSGLVARRLAPSRLSLCASPGYIEQEGEPTHPDDLVNHHCLEYSLRTSLGRWTFTGPNGNEVSVRISGRLRATNGEVLRAAAVAGLGVTLAPTFLVRDDLQSGRLARLLPEYEPKPTAIYALQPPGRRPPAKVRSFIDFLVSQFGPPPPWDSA